MQYQIQKNVKKLINEWRLYSLSVVDRIGFTLLFSSLLFSVFLILLCCTDQEQTLDEQASALELQTLPEVVHPLDNPTSPEKIELGRILFWDPILSGERNIACVTCHRPELGYGDAIDLSRGPGGHGIGVNRVGAPDRPIAIRNSTSIINSAFVGLRDANQQLDVVNAPMTWTINRRDLERQALAGALINPTHMRGTGKYDGNSVRDTLAQRLKKIAEYVNLFDRAFGGGAASVSGINIGKALGAFQRSIVSNNSPYDKYAKGQLNALTDQQKEGLLLFFGKANCSNCHGGAMFSDYATHNLGIPDHPLVSPKDKGANGQRLFRTPSLRNVELTAPYMHNGTIPTLKDVVDFYNEGVSENDSVSQNQISIKIRPLHLSDEEKDALVSFLGALTDDSYDKTIPAAVPSRLKVGGN